MSNWLKLIGLNLIIAYRNLFAFFRTLVCYWPNSAFRHAHLRLLWAYLFACPYRVSKHFLIHRGEKEVYTYGETPLASWEMILKRAKVSKDDTLIELGCGRGLTCFFAAAFFHCQVIGIDYNPTFIKRANLIKSPATFLCQDMLAADLSKATVIYLFGTCLTDGAILTLIDHFSRLSKEARIITVSFSLLDYVPEAPFELIDHFEAPFLFGMAEVFIHRGPAPSN